MKFKIHLLAGLAFALAALGGTPAAAQNPATVKLCVPTSPTACAAVSATNPLPITGSFSATLAGFTPNGNYTTLTATASSSASTALPAGTVVAFQNLSSVDVSCVLTAGASTATTNKLIVRAGATVYYTVGSNTTTACINQTGSASNVVGLAGGAGLGTAFGGASAGGGGGGAVTIASGAVASGAYSSGSIASGAVASGAIASGAYAAGSIGAGAVAAGAFVSGSVLSGAFASGSLAAGAMVDLLTMRQTVAAGTVASNSLLTGGIYNSTPITLTNGQGAAMQFDANGYLKVNTAAGAAAGGTSSNFGSAFPTPGTAVGFTDGTNMVAGRVGAVANVAAATNMINVLGAAQYNATPLTVTDTRYQSLQSDVNGFLKVTVTNTLTALTPGDAITAGTYASGSPVLGGVLLFNGTTYDRARSGTTTGSTLINGAGTAGSAAGGVVTVQGVASMTPLLANPGTAANWGVGATGAAVPANATMMGFNSGGNLTAPAVATPLPVRQSDGTNVAILDPCQTTVNSTARGNITSATTTRIITPSASNKTYICSVDLLAFAANNVAVVEGTGGTCGTGTAGVIGGTTTGNGISFAAQGGLVKGGAGFFVWNTAGTNVDFCLITSTTGPLAYFVKYVQAP